MLVQRRDRDRYAVASSVVLWGKVWDEMQKSLSASDVNNTFELRVVRSNPLVRHLVIFRTKLVECNDAFRKPNSILANSRSALSSTTTCYKVDRLLTSRTIWRAHL